MNLAELQDKVLHVLGLTLDAVERDVAAQPPSPRHNVRAIGVSGRSEPVTIAETLTPTSSRLVDLVHATHELWSLYAKMNWPSPDHGLAGAFGVVRRHDLEARNRQLDELFRDELAKSEAAANVAKSDADPSSGPLD